MKIGVECGHSLNSYDYGAIGCTRENESELTRQVGKKVMELFRQNGHEVIDCTVDNCTSLSDSLGRRVSKANSNNVDYYISIHFNAFNGQARGTEILYCSSSDDKMQRILNNIVSLGYYNRGLKKDGRGLAVLQQTRMKAMLIECCFCDNKEDMARYNADDLARAIVGGFLNKSMNSLGKTTKTSNKSNKTTNANNSTNEIEKCKQYVGGRCKELQEKLNACGYNCGAVDGDFGQATYSALIKFQSENGLVADGLAGEMTFNKLNSIIEANKKKNEPKVSAHLRDWQSAYNDSYGKSIIVDGIKGQQVEQAMKEAILSTGSNNPLVAWLQCRIGADIDGKFGKGTKAKLVEFQNNNGLSADGICGYNTWKKLFEIYK